MLATQRLLTLLARWMELTYIPGRPELPMLRSMDVVFCLSGRYPWYRLASFPRLVGREENRWVDVMNKSRTGRRNLRPTQL